MAFQDRRRELKSAVLTKLMMYVDQHTCRSLSKINAAHANFTSRLKN